MTDLLDGILKALGPLDPGELDRIADRQRTREKEGLACFSHLVSSCDINYLLNLVDEQQAKLDACAEMATLWRMQITAGEIGEEMEEQLAMVDELEVALDG